MAEIKAIETYYKGHRFRSRLEARWAVFFDAAGIEYEYEPEGYRLEDGTLYLPDFYLPKEDVHAEVKRDTSDGIAEVMEKCSKAITWGGPIKALVILSDIPEGKSPDGGMWHFPTVCWRGTNKTWGWSFYHDDVEGVILDLSINSVYPYASFYIREKESIKAVSDYELRQDSWVYRSICNRDDKRVIEDIEFQESCNANTFAAFRAARSARFEHGEKPRV